MRRTLLLLAGLLSLSLLLQVANAMGAPPPWYTSGAGISVTQANSTITFTDNHSGGDSVAFAARWIKITSASTSANTCMFDLSDGTAATTDQRIAPSGTYTWTMPSGYGPEAGLLTMGAICSSGQTATFYIEATR